MPDLNMQAKMENLRDVCSTCILLEPKERGQGRRHAQIDSECIPLRLSSPRVASMPCPRPLAHPQPLLSSCFTLVCLVACCFSLVASFDFLLIWLVSSVVRSLAACSLVVQRGFRFCRPGLVRFVCLLFTLASSVSFCWFCWFCWLC